VRLDLQKPISNAQERPKLHNFSNHMGQASAQNAGILTSWRHLFPCAPSLQITINNFKFLVFFEKQGLRISEKVQA